jgi:hypothetical protein
MSSSCMHAQNSDWTGPTPKGVLAASGNPEVYVCFTNSVSGEKVMVNIGPAFAQFTHQAGFEGRCIGGAKAKGIVCNDPCHLGRVHIELDIEPAAPLLSIVAEAG